MRKLRQPVVNEICRQMSEGKLSVWRIAKRANVSKQWVYELYGRYKQTGVPPVRRRCGRKPQELPQAVRKRIKQLHAVIPCSAIGMEQRLAKQGLKVSHNKIHAVLKEHGLAKREPKKSKKRKWVRYERRKANSLWHTDWKEIDGKHLILFEDDATRLIVGYGLFDSPTAENALQTFAVSTANYGMPRQLLSDNGSQFCNTHDKHDLKHVFHGGVQRAGCEHIFTRPSHPQCNGKLEKLNHTISKLYHYYNCDLNKTVRVYNEKRLHMSLEWQTPLETWQNKLKRGLKYEQTTKT